MNGPFKLIDIELSHPLKDVENLHEYSALKGLVRLHGFPLGYVQLSIENGHCCADKIGYTILNNYSEAIVQRLLQQGLAAGSLPDPLNIDSLLHLTPPQFDGPYPLVTVAVCTRDRTVDLALCLEGLTQLDYPNLEILIIDNAPRTEATKALLEAQYTAFNYVCEPRPGLDWARNRAIIEARGEIIAFTDDDVVVDAGWVTALVQPFIADDSVMAVTGLVIPYELETEAQVMFETYGGFSRGFQQRWHRVSKQGVQWEYRGTGQFGTGANMAYRRTVFDLIGPFDPALDVGTLTNGGGDLEMFFRVLKEGYTLVYEPGAIIRHRHRQTYEQLRRQLSYNGVALYAFFVCAALAYPDERRAFLRLGLWWFMWWFVRRLLLSFLNAYPLPRDLIWAELRQVFVGLTAYQRARRQAQSIEADFKVLPTLSYLTRRSASSQTGAAYATAVRTIDLSQPVSGLSGLESYASLRIFVTWKGQLLGNIDLTNHFKNISRQQLLAAIVDGLGLKLVYLDKSTNHNRTWREINDKLEAYLLADQPQKGGQTETHLAPDISVSVIVGTCDRPEDLANCLTNLQQQKTSRPVEIVVVDNNPTSGQTPPVTAAFPQVVLVNEPRKGVAYARNAGIEASTGDIIVTTDDDVTMPADWLENLLAPFSQPHVMAVTGNILPLELETDSQHLFELYGGLGRGYEPKEADPNWFQRFKLRAVPTWEYGGTANAAFRAGLFQNPDIGLMDESLGPGMPSGVGEDTYLFYRILQAGGTIRYEPTAYVWHKHRRTLKALRRQIYNYSKGHVAYHLTTLFRDKDLRALLQLTIWLPLGHLWRIYQRLRGKSSYTLLFLLIEIAGNLRGPGALIQSLWLVNRQGRSRSIRQPNRSAALKQPAAQPQHFNPS